MPTFRQRENPLCKLDSFPEIRLFSTLQHDTHISELDFICGMSDLPSCCETALPQYRFCFWQVANGKEILNLAGNQTRSQPARRAYLDQFLRFPKIFRCAVKVYFREKQAG